MSARLKSIFVFLLSLIVKVLILVFILFLLVFLFFSAWNLIVRKAPLSYFGYVNVVHLKQNPFLHRIYHDYYAKNMAKVFKEQRGLLFAPTYSGIMKLNEKDYMGDYYYEVFGNVISSRVSGKDIRIVLEHKKGMWIDLEGNLSDIKFYKIEKSGDFEDSGTVKSALYYPGLLETGKRVRVRFSSNEDIARFENGKINGVIKLICSDLDWLYN